MVILPGKEMGAEKEKRKGGGGGRDYEKER